MAPDELITSIRWNIPDRSDILKLYKVSKRKDLDISTFTAGILLKLKHGKIKKARLAYGGVGPIVLRLPETERFLEGKPVTNQFSSTRAELPLMKYFQFQMFVLPQVIVHSWLKIF